MSETKTYEIRVPGKVVELFDSTSWGTEGIEVDSSARRKIETAPFVKIGKGRQLRPELTAAELVAVAGSFDSWAGAAEAGARDAFGDRSEDGLRWARQAQAEAALLRKVADRAGAVVAEAARGGHRVDSEADRDDEGRRIFHTFCQTCDERDEDGLLSSHTWRMAADDAATLHRIETAAAETLEVGTRPEDDVVAEAEEILEDVAADEEPPETGGPFEDDGEPGLRMPVELEVGDRVSWVVFEAGRPMGRVRHRVVRVLDLEAGPGGNFQKVENEVGLELFVGWHDSTTRVVRPPRDDRTLAEKIAPRPDGIGIDWLENEPSEADPETGLEVVTTEPLGAGLELEDGGPVDLIIPAGTRCSVVARDARPGTFVLRPVLDLRLDPGLDLVIPLVSRSQFLELVPDGELLALVAEAASS